MRKLGLVAVIVTLSFNPAAALPTEGGRAGASLLQGADNGTMLVAQKSKKAKKRSGAAATSPSRQYDPGGGTGMTGAPSSTNPQAGGGYQGTPREVPSSGGVPHHTVNPKR